eukprot:TRINITY_DN16238_c0_g1_i2.p1 TRINITY_DN16238_c0_g1~~TRINITY_DN16238_c0_g1_i2.p1  ORF type:complete len:1210 (-),score=197.28 TRINITY_DN16238_c0_g1_i2:509-4138(-)
MADSEHPVVSAAAAGSATQSPPSEEPGAEDNGDPLFVDFDAEAEDEEEDDDDEEDERPDEAALSDTDLATAIQRTDAGELALVQSVGIQGVHVTGGFRSHSDSEDDDVSEHSDSNGDGSDGASPSDRDWLVVGQEGPSAQSRRTVDAALREEPDEEARAPFWVVLDSAAVPQLRANGQAHMHALMLECGSHVQVKGSEVTIMSSSRESRKAALEFLKSLCGGDANAAQHQGQLIVDEEDDAEDPEEIPVSEWRFPSDRRMQHACVYPTSLEDTIEELYLSDFRDAFPFTLDPFQKHACTCVDRGESVLVSANTSAGKTVVAEFAIRETLKRDRRVLYTTPLKALSNQKYVEMQERFPDRVGLMTGDVTMNPDADIIILTTEVLVAMLYHHLPNQPDLLDNFNWVIFDEAQYLGDEKRGSAWEECFIFLPHHLRCVLLSATVPNAMSIASWIARTRFEVLHIVTSKWRPVPLRHEVFLCGDPDPYDRRSFLPVFTRGRRWNPRFGQVMEERSGSLGARNIQVPERLVGRFIGQKGQNLRALREEAGGAWIELDRRPPYVVRIWAQDDRTSRRAHAVVRGWLAEYGHIVPEGVVAAGSTEVDGRDLERLLCLLKYRQQLPLISFSFEKKQCEQIALTLAARQRMDFASEEKKRLINAEIQKGLGKLSEDDRKLQQVEVSMQLLRRGIGVHHSGMLPFVRELVELLFSRSLLEVVFATDTFAIGLNMPAKTVVFCSLSKFDGIQKRALHAGEFRQMAGRAGRRGIDKSGTAIVLARQPYEANRRTADILYDLYSDVVPQVKSRFQLRWSSLVHLLREGPGHIQYALSRSFREASVGDVTQLLEDGGNMKTILRQRDFIDASCRLLPKGQVLSRLSVPNDPVFVAEALVATQCFAGLSAPQIFALCSCFVGDGPPARQKVYVEARPVYQTLRKVEKVGAKLYDDLVDHQLEKHGNIVWFLGTRIHRSLVNTTLLWAEGKTFSEAVRLSGIAVGGEGVLVRALRRLDELIREIAYICRHILGLPHLAKALQETRDLTRRGVLVVPSLYLGDAEDALAEPISPEMALPRCPHMPGTWIELSPADVGFTHDSISEHFRKSRVSLLTTARALLHGWNSWRELPPVRVFWHRGRFYTLANRRLAAARLWFMAVNPEDGEKTLSGMQFLVASTRDAERWGWQEKFTTGFTQGRSVRIRESNKRVGLTRKTTTFGRELWN